MEVGCRFLSRSLIQSRALCSTFLRPANVKQREFCSAIPVWHKLPSTLDHIDTISSTDLRLPCTYGLCPSEEWLKITVVPRSESVLARLLPQPTPASFSMNQDYQGICIFYSDAKELENSRGILDKDSINIAVTEGDVSGHVAGIYCSSVLKKRRKKMNRHKYRKWRKRMRFIRQAQKK